jgi:hypothetical protein
MLPPDDESRSLKTLFLVPPPLLPPPLLLPLWHPRMPRNNQTKRPSPAKHFGRRAALRSRTSSHLNQKVHPANFPVHLVPGPFPLGGGWFVVARFAPVFKGHFSFF